MNNRKAADAATQTETQAADAGAGNVSTVALATPAQPTTAQPPARDEHQGRGGLYRRNADGSRELIERTKPASPLTHKKQE